MPDERDARQVLLLSTKPPVVVAHPLTRTYQRLGAFRDSSGDAGCAFASERKPRRV
jgi:hypothetical protein